MYLCGGRPGGPSKRHHHAGGTIQVAGTHETATNSSIVQRDSSFDSQYVSIVLRHHGTLCCCRSSRCDAVAISPWHAAHRTCPGQSQVLLWATVLRTFGTQYRGAGVPRKGFTLRRANWPGKLSTPSAILFGVCLSSSIIPSRRVQCRPEYLLWCECVIANECILKDVAHLCSTGPSCAP